jgi:cystathionine gamma-synthase
VTSVLYPSLADHPHRDRARSQMSSGGAVVSFILDGDAAAAEHVCAHTTLWTHATSLGGVESTLERRGRWPAESPDVPESLIRLSVGIEDVDDLWRDLASALDA